MASCAGERAAALEVRRRLWCNVRLASPFLPGASMRQLFCFAFFAAVSLPVFALTPTEVVGAYHVAVAHGETAKALSLLSPAVQIYESGHVEQSKDEYAGHHLAADVAFAKGTSRKVLKGSERIGGDLAVVVQETETRGTYNGTAIHMLGTETAVLEKKGDGWVVTHFHWSSRKAK
jgi:ketosteroid isomerase-like protein